ncbi:TetR/AcrR family transcriptional regulator [Streptacidiphilus sp. P02-A3a]|uniref:TetR/AcrR family transcriptional regulator n=1 Tax=Streptacidiphilus sp. P02-A3a TaxID=2704468 RepID=UPI0015FDDFD7|nr:TetR/AcrR family transcriptional regulator [Streptacidiphilus sp. P02-A3a]QMU68973.1 TetR/AcrR family transcriptional regulator [Streptacidiphilus sp. P02-A3a]
MAPAAKPVRPTTWAAAEARPPRRRALGRDAIVETALGIIDAEGLDALSMRRVAQELNTGAASLYAHVSGKEELVELVLDLAYRDLVHPDPDPAIWRAQVKDFLRQARDHLVAHHDLARAALASNIPTLPHQLDAAETVLSLLRAGGLPDQVAAYGVDLIGLYLVASAHELSQRHSGAVASPEQDQAYLDGVRAYFGSLPADRYPVLVSMIDPMTRNEGDERFDFGLDVILAGLVAQAQSAAQSSAPPALGRVDRAGDTP